MFFITQRIFIFIKMPIKGTIHKVCTQRGGERGEAPKRTLPMKATLFPIQNAYRGSEGVQKLGNLCVRTLWMVPKNTCCLGDHVGFWAINSSVRDQLLLKLGSNGS